MPLPPACCIYSGAFDWRLQSGASGKSLCAKALLCHPSERLPVVLSFLEELVAQAESVQLQSCFLPISWAQGGCFTPRLNRPSTQQQLH